MTFRKEFFTSPPVLYFDFIDPLSYRVSRLIDRAGASSSFEWRGFELCPPPEPMIDPRSAEWRARQAVAAGHPERPDRGGPGPPPIIPWTRKAHELCEFARDRDCLHEVRRALFQACFVDHTDIGRIDLLVEIARDAGLDPSETGAVLGVDRYTGTVVEHRRRALAEGIGDVPALAGTGGWVEGPDLLREIEATTHDNGREE